MKDISDCKWVIEFENETYECFEELLFVISKLKELEINITGDVTLWYKINDTRRYAFLRRLFAIKRTHSVFFTIRWKDEYAAMFFSDSQGSEYWVLKTNYKSNASEASREIRMALSFGELTPLPHEYCLPKKYAFSLIYESIHLNERPRNIEYKYVR